MNEQTEMTTRQEDGALRAPTERELILRPAVDIFEDANAVAAAQDRGQDGLKAR
jgi:hypothetical protein